MSDRIPAAEPTDAMVDAYLQAQRRAVEEADRFGRPNIGGLHTDTVREACRAGLKSAIAAAQPAADPVVDFPMGAIINGNIYAERQQWVDFQRCFGYLADWALSRVAQPARAGGDAWPNGCNRTVPDALRYLARHPRPAGGQEQFNAEHLFQLADEIERSALAAAPQQEAPADFPPRILALLRDVSDRKGTGTAGPWEDANGEPLQDDAEAALRWIVSRAAAPQPAAAEPAIGVTAAVQAVIRTAMEWGRQYLSPAPREAIEEAVQHYAEKAVAACAPVEQPAASTVPAGFKLVPLELTREMDAAGYATLPVGLRYIGYEFFRVWYDAALGAAPAAPAAVEREAQATARELDLIAKIEAECDHAGINGHKLENHWGGPDVIAVREENIHAAIEGWRREHGIPIPGPRYNPAGIGSSKEGGAA